MLAHHMKTPLCAVGLLLAAAGFAAAAAEKRVALVIGNAAYEHASRLANPVNDAADIGAALGRLGFAVTKLENAGKSAFERGLQTFARAAATSEIALVFYAGHGIEIDQRNFLIPVDARLASDRDVEFEAVPLDLVSRAVDSARELRLIVLDACRDNPFAAAMKRSGATRSIGRGLARVEPAGETLVAYAAKGGSVASDGEGRNSPYSTALLGPSGGAGARGRADVPQGARYGVVRHGRPAGALRVRFPLEQGLLSVGAARACPSGDTGPRGREHRQERRAVVLAVGTGQPGSGRPRSVSGEVSGGRLCGAGAQPDQAAVGPAAPGHRRSGGAGSVARSQADRAAADPDRPVGNGLRSWWSGRIVQPTHAGGDWQLAGVTGQGQHGLSRRRRGEGPARGGAGPVGRCLGGRHRHALQAVEPRSATE